MSGREISTRRLRASSIALALSCGLGACISTLTARVDPDAPGTLRLRNESDETVCYVTIARVLVGGRGERALDRLDHDEVVLPGEERDFVIEGGADEPRNVRVLDCAERELFAGQVVVDAEHGVRVTLSVR